MALLTEMLQTVTVPGSEWHVSQQGIRTCSRLVLNSQARVWYHWLRTRAIPTSHDTTVSQDRVLLLYCVMTGKSVNLGRLIYRALTTCAFKETGKLCFPSLITELCSRAEVPIGPYEETVKNSGIISWQTINRISKNVPAPTRPDAAASSSAVPLESIEHLLNSVVTNQRQMTAYLQHMEQQHHTYWEYSKKKDVAIKKALQKNFTKPMPPFPDFPDEVLQPWQASSDENEDDN